jgi:hypothetical protein
MLSGLLKALHPQMWSHCRTSAVWRIGTPLALCRVEVLPMHIPSALKITALGLSLSSVAFAQSPAPTPPTPVALPPDAAAIPAPTQLSMVTESSRVRAFNAGPGGEVRSLYLQNGSVVDLAAGLGGQIGPAVRKGEKITVTGTKSEINGQSLVEAASVRLNDQTFSANAPAPGQLAEGVAPRPPGVSQAPPAPASRRKNRAAAPAPCGATADAPPPPEGPDGPPPPGFEAGAPPPPPSGAAPPPPTDGMAPPPPPQD